MKVLSVGVQLYDPRDNTMKQSDNPALWMADMIVRGIVSVDTKTPTFWLDIINMANYCEEGDT